MLDLCLIEILEIPEGLGTAGNQFWAEPYGQPRVASFTWTMIALIARKLCEHETVGAGYYQTPAHQWRQQRTLKDIDRA